LYFVPLEQMTCVICVRNRIGVAESPVLCTHKTRRGDRFLPYRFFPGSRNNLFIDPPTGGETKYQSGDRKLTRGSCYRILTFTLKYSSVIADQQEHNAPERKSWKHKHKTGGLHPATFS